MHNHDNNMSDNTNTQMQKMTEKRDELLDQAGQVQEQLLERAGEVADEVKQGAKNIVDLVDEKEDKADEVTKDASKEADGLLDKAGEVTQHVLDEAGKAATSVKEGALDMFKTDMNPDPGNEAAKGDASESSEVLDRAALVTQQVLGEAGKTASEVKEAAVNMFDGQAEEKDAETEAAAEENERKIDELLDQAGKVADQALNQANQTATDVKEALTHFDAKVKEIPDEVDKEEDSPKENSFLLRVNQTGEVVKQVVDEAGKAASDVKDQAVNLLDKTRNVEGKNEATSESASN